MKKILTVISGTLALNFLALAGFVYWLHSTGKLDSAKIKEIKQLVFAPATQPTTQPSTQPSTQPTLNLDQLLAKVAGRPPGEQLEFMQQTFDSQRAILERRLHDLLDLRRGIDVAQDQLRKDREALAADRKRLEEERKLAAAGASDKGFKDTLERYESMQPKQVKAVFMGLDDATVVRYLQAMEPRNAAKIVKEFKTPQETERIGKIMERMRQAQASTRE